MPSLAEHMHLATGHLSLSVFKLQTIPQITPVSTCYAMPCSVSMVIFVFFGADDVSVTIVYAEAAALMPFLASCCCLCYYVRDRCHRSHKPLLVFTQDS